MTTHPRDPRRFSVPAFGLTAGLVLAACSPAPMPVARSSTDPSSPSAPEGVSPTAALASAPPPAPAAAGHDHHHHQAAGADAGAEGVVYVCPMHPEVTSTSPGSVCPKCNMKLVPRK